MVRAAQRAPDGDGAEASRPGFASDASKGEVTSATERPTPTTPAAIAAATDGLVEVMVDLLGLSSPEMRECRLRYVNVMGRPEAMPGCLAATSRRVRA